MKDLLKNNINKIHTTILGVDRIKKNLKIDCDVIDYCKKIILNNKSTVIKNGKNYYIKYENIIITINSYSYTIITAKTI